MAASSEVNILSNRGEKIAQFPAIGTRQYKILCADNPYNEEHNPTGVIDLSCAESHISANLIEEWMSKNDNFKWTVEDQFYYPYEGENTVRQKYADFVNKRFHTKFPVTGENIVLGHGAEGIMESLAFSLADPGDYFMIFTPFYYNIEENFGLRAGVKILPIHPLSNSAKNNLFEFSLADLEDEYRKAVKKGYEICGIIFVNPNNPLGTIASNEDLTTLIQFCTRNNLHLISDEVYSQITFREDEKFTSVLSLDLPNPDLIHVVYSLSKDFGLSGLRVGILISQNKNLLKSFHVQALYSSVPTIIARTAANLVNDDNWLDNTYYPKILPIIRENYDKVTTVLKQIEVDYVEASGGFFVWANFSKYIQPCTFQNETIFANELAKNGLCLMAGEAFHCSEPGWFRILITHSAKTTDLALSRLEDFVKKPNLFDIYIKLDIQLDDFDIEIEQGGGGIEDLLLTLHKQLKTTDWLDVNTPEKFEAENPEIADIFAKLREENNQ